MEIDKGDKSGTPPQLRHIKPGTAFLNQGEVYIKSCHVVDDAALVMSVEEGRLLEMDLDDRVHPYHDARIVLEP